MNNKLNNHELDFQATVFEVTGSPTFAAVFRELLAYRKAESNPIAEIVSKHGDPEAFGERELQVIADIRAMPYGTNLYASPFQKSK